MTDAAPVDAPVADAGSVLYPDDQAPADTQATDETPPADEGAWKEYEPDPERSDEENAAAKAEHDAAKPADDPADTVPEDGKYDLKMPDGVEVDQALLDEIGPEFKELGLTTKQAQSLADKFIAAQEAKGKAQADGWSKTVADWVDTAKADPEMGGAKWDSTVKAASGVVGKFGNDGLKEFLNASGAGNHPEMIRFMAKVGAVISEDNPAISENPGKMTPRDSAAILYPDDQPKGK
ncbi:MAG TPA: hypothetical protein VIG24_14530 [Acidimicrobiia bacterium]